VGTAYRNGNRFCTKSLEGKGSRALYVKALFSYSHRLIKLIPPVRWDPERKDPLFMGQSAMLYLNYYYIQIMVHRPYIPLPGKPSPISLPSLAICTNAARACCNIVDIHRRQTGKHLVLMDVSSPAPLTPERMLMHFKGPAFISSAVLLLMMWGSIRAGFSTDTQTGLRDVRKCMAAIKSTENRFASTGKLMCVFDSVSSRNSSY
jgi:hypothetical protein